MKLANYKDKNQDLRLGVMHDDKIYDLNEAISYIDNVNLSGVAIPKDMLELIRENKHLENARLINEAIISNVQKFNKASKTLDEINLLAPVTNPEKIVCVGLNYEDHAKEGGYDLPKEPVLFGKYANSIIGPGVAIRLNPMSSKTDYEAELAMIIGKKACCVEEDDAMDYVLGFTNANDVSARDLQKRDGQWIKGKFLDTFLPIGPYLVTLDELNDPEDLSIELRLNGDTKQSSRTGDMIFSLKHIVSFISNFATLEPGDIIITGTPAGCGYAQAPPIFLKNGDVVEVETEGLGVLRNPVTSK